MGHNTNPLKSILKLEMETKTFKRYPKNVSPVIFPVVDIIVVWRVFIGIADYLQLIRQSLPNVQGRS